jgi:hypothetical protein
MWEARDLQDDEYELLPRAIDPLPANDGADGDVRSMSSVNIRTESYQSTARLIVWAFALIAALLLVFTCAAFGSSLTSNKKAFFHVSGVMPSVSLGSGDCETLKYVNYSIHLLINCVGTIIIGCSNYLQQSNV